VGRKTQPKRMQATLLKIKAVLRERMHERVNVVGQWLKRLWKATTAIMLYREHGDVWASSAPALQPVARHARASQPAQPSELEAFRPTFERWVPPSSRPASLP